MSFFPKLRRLVVSTALCAMLAAGASPFPKAPKLVLFIAIDQFRYDYLTRFAGEYKGGLDRLLNHGAVFTNANLAHFPSVTAVGHSTMLTGATPAISGIVGNEWFDRATSKTVTSVSDDAVREVGAGGVSSASPRKLLVSTVGDELKASNGGRSKVIGISIKDRAAILMSGHAADAAYWYDTRSGSFISSTYYFDQLPAWVREFNGAHYVKEFAGQEWGAPGALHRMPEPGARLSEAVYSSPYGNEMVERFAEHAIDAERLGRHDATDLLALSFSSIDAVGHERGPDSAEVHDLCIRIDRTLANLFAHVEKTVGMRDVLVVLTADHGVAAMPETNSGLRKTGGRFEDAAIRTAVESVLQRRFGPGPWVRAVFGESVYLDYSLIGQKALRSGDIEDVAADALMNLPQVFRVYTHEHNRLGQAPTDYVSGLVLRSFNWTRSADLQVVLSPNWVRAKTNTTHDAPFAYDTHIPLIFLGAAVPAGLRFENVTLNDLAPTLATMLSIQTPSGSVGRIIPGLVTPTAAR